MKYLADKFALEYDQFMSSWRIIQLRLALYVFRVIICIMTKSEKKMTHEVFLTSRFLLKSDKL
jgi:hypothetical protein